MQEPPGGPPDSEPPVLVVATPESGSVQDGFRDEVSFEFDEVIAEQGIENLVVVSPRPRELDVSWKRRRITVRPKGGWIDSVTYAVTLLPGVADLRQNRLDSGRTVLFSTGGPIPQTRITGTVVDWEAGRLARLALVEAMRPSDSLTYVGSTDSSGAYLLSALQPGTYVLFGVIDQNHDRERNARESFDSITVQVDSILTHDLWTFPHDTVGPRIRQVERLDSMAVSVVFTSPVQPAATPPGEVLVRVMPDSQLVAVDTVLWPSVFDSIQTAVRDSIQAATRDSAATAGAAADTTAVDTSGVVPRPVQPVQPTPPPVLPTPVPPAADTAVADSAQEILAQRPPLVASIVIVLVDPLRPGTRYIIETTVPNVQGYVATSLRPLEIPAAAADSS
jgi:Bacterial Ig-like domain